MSDQEERERERERERGSHGCLRHLQDDIGRTHRSAASSILLLPKGTSYHTHTHSLSLSLTHISPTHTHTHTHTPGPWRRGSTWPNTPAAPDWLLEASNTPPAPQPARLCLETERLRCYHYRPLLQHRSALLWSPSLFQKMSDSLIVKILLNHTVNEWLNRTWWCAIKVITFGLITWCCTILLHHNTGSYTKYFTLSEFRFIVFIFSWIHE